MRVRKATMITGSASGLGKEFAKIYAERGDDLILVDCDFDKLKAVKKEIGILYGDVEVVVLEADLSRYEDLKRIRYFCEEEGFFVRCLVNCAGFGDQNDFRKMAVDRQIEMTEVDCNAPLYLTRVFLENMLKYDEGHIINVSSVAGLYPGPYMATYHACKAYLLSLGTSVAYELRKTPVRLLSLCPGPFYSDFVDRAHNEYTFTKIKPVRAETVARYGYRMSEKGKSFAIVGAKNKIAFFLSRFLPRRAIAFISARLIKPIV